MNRHTTVLAILLLVALLSACGTTGPRPVEPIVWPSAPATARFRLVELYVDAADVGVGQGFLARSWNWLTGRSGFFATGVMAQPTAVTEWNGTVYVADSTAGTVRSYNKKENTYREGKLPEGAFPVGITTVPTVPGGSVYVSDSGNGVIHLFDAQLEYRGEFQTAVRFKRPTGLWYDGARDCLYVVDTLSHTVTALNLDGTLRWQTGGNGAEPGRFNRPTYVCQSGDKIYVTDSMNHRVQILGLDGAPLGRFGSNGRGLGQFAMPKGIGVDSEGHIYVADSGFNNVQVFTADGKHLLLYIGSLGVGQGRFSLPVGLYVSPQDKIYVADSYNRRIQVLQYLGGER